MYIDLKSWNPSFSFEVPTGDLPAAIVAAEKTEAEAELQPLVPVFGTGDDMSKFKPSGDVTGVTANDGETIHAPLAGKTPEEIFHAHNVGVDLSGPIEIQNLCQCRDCQTYIAEVRK